MKRHSQNNQPPAFGPTMPIYPGLPQLVRTTAGALPGTNVYPCLTQQYGGSLNLRDREPAYVSEPNGIRLGPGYYDCRLVGNYLSLPLYATACCPGGSFSSSSLASGQSLYLPTAIMRTSMGTGNSLGNLVTGIAIDDVTLPMGILSVNVATFGGDSLGILTVTWGPITLTQAISATLPLGAAVTGTVQTFRCIIPAAATHDIDISVAAGTTAFLANAIGVTGLATNTLDQVCDGFGTASTPDAGDTPETTVEDEYAQGAMAFITPSGAWDWVNGFEDGGQDVSASVLGSVVWLTEGSRILDDLEAVEPQLDGMVTAAWAAVGATYK